MLVTCWATLWNSGDWVGWHHVVLSKEGKGNNGVDVYQDEGQDGGQQDGGYVACHAADDIL